MKLLPSEVLELSILEFTRLPGAERWRATTLPSLALSVKSQDWDAVSHALRRLHDQSVLSIRKWMEPHGLIVPEKTPTNTRFLNQGGFQFKNTPPGRLYIKAPY